jgi:sporulation protein YlmC with PRC-barrel domain
MSISRHTRTLSVAALLACSPLAVHAQTTTTPDTTDRPQLTEPPRPAEPAMKPAEPTRPALPRTTEQTAPKVNPLVGLAVFSSDGSKLGNVHSVNVEPDGKVKAIHIKTGGFLGIGGKLVAIPDSKFTRSGENIQLGLTSDEVSKLPEVKEQS